MSTLPYMPASSKEDLFVDFDRDLTAFPIEIAVVLESEGEPADGEYHAATWEEQSAKLLIGAGSDVELAQGNYVVWVRLTAGDERPVRRSGTLTVGAP